MQFQLFEETDFFDRIDLSGNDTNVLDQFQHPEDVLTLEVQTANFDEYFESVEEYLKTHKQRNLAKGIAKLLTIVHRDITFEEDCVEPLFPAFYHKADFRNWYSATLHLFEDDTDTLDNCYFLEHIHDAIVHFSHNYACTGNPNKIKYLKRRLTYKFCNHRFGNSIRIDDINSVVGWQDNQERIFFCFNAFNLKKSCQTFDGRVIRNVDVETVYAHDQGCIGTFERNKVVVAIGGREAAGKTEIFDGTSWRAGPDQPNNLTQRGVAVDVGAGIITIGGYGDVNGYSAYLLTYDNMIENTKKLVDLGRLNSYYVYNSIFRFGEIIVAHRQSIPNAGIYMLTWNGNSLEDQGMQIDLGLIGESSGIFIPKEKTKCESIFIGDTPQRDTDVEEEIIFEQQCNVRNSDACVIKLEVECDFDQIQEIVARSYFVGTSNYNFPFRIDTIWDSSGKRYNVALFTDGYETIETFADDVRAEHSLYFDEDICTNGDYMEIVIKQWADNEGTWRKTLEIDGVLMSRYTSLTAPTSSSIINGRLGFADTDESSFAYRNSLGVKNFSIREY
ncbi:unnamed protein product [Oikopleura dioica]|uniref:Uncharacterized protein n=1 Tax=Oikopleura dioica TaxID=34765 RepID=E4YST2_OIKDI|nr:unnamed protein product [Oikopleura dioica]